MVVNAFNPLALGRQGQADLLEFQASQVYRVSFRKAGATQRHPVSINQNKQQQQKKKPNPSTQQAEAIRSLESSLHSSRTSGLHSETLVWKTKLRTITFFTLKS